VAVDGSGHQLHRDDQAVVGLGKDGDGGAEFDLRNRVLRGYQGEARGRAISGKPLEEVREIAASRSGCWGSKGATSTTQRGPCPEGRYRGGPGRVGGWRRVWQMARMKMKIMLLFMRGSFFEFRELLPLKAEKKVGMGLSEPFFAL